MKTTSKPKIVIFGDPRKGHVSKTIDEFTEFVKDKVEIVATYCVDKCTIEDFQDSDFAFVFGGDGSIISAAKNVKQNAVPVVGVNLGKLGFLAEFNMEELKQSFDDILAGKLRIEERMMINCKVLSSGKESLCTTAINDVVITSGPPFQMIELQISVNEQLFAGCISDGLIISTPTGSTAYNLSAGGPILSGDMEGMVITALCPHSLGFRPIVINPKSKIKVKAVRVNQGTTISVDGQVSLKFTKDDVVCIEKEQSSFLVVNNPNHNHWETLATKLRWAEKPKYER